MTLSMAGWSAASIPMMASAKTVLAFSSVAVDGYVPVLMVDKKREHIECRHTTNPQRNVMLRCYLLCSLVSVAATAIVIALAAVAVCSF
eukprot:CAMPEP_0168300826 /NCGR_PEP_ID=MMETSP0142_2-20121227/32352_1 /TAXON_ID=44445 /ORGANISM="Pseudo-nitzschia australis, Strain 10249 10 AB" /LENGTH=88 /DNA_ID=CAMNT_0008250919 /DNA_START=37 /DNA_END=300 /DNA_ORIENTATION=+